MPLGDHIAHALYIIEYRSNFSILSLLYKWAVFEKTKCRAAWMEDFYNILNYVLPATIPFNFVFVLLDWTWTLLCPRFWKESMYSFLDCTRKGTLTDYDVSFIHSIIKISFQKIRIVRIQVGGETAKEHMLYNLCVLTLLWTFSRFFSVTISPNILWFLLWSLFYHEHVYFNGSSTWSVRTLLKTRVQP